MTHSHIPTPTNTPPPTDVYPNMAKDVETSVPSCHDSTKLDSNMNQAFPSPPETPTMPVLSIPKATPTIQINVSEHDAVEGQSPWLLASNVPLSQAPRLSLQLGSSEFDDLAHKVLTHARISTLLEASRPAAPRPSVRPVAKKSALKKSFSGSLSKGSRPRVQFNLPPPASPTRELKNFPPRTGTPPPPALAMKSPLRKRVSRIPPQVVRQVPMAVDRSQIDTTDQPVKPRNDSHTAVLREKQPFRSLSRTPSPPSDLFESLQRSRSRATTKDKLEGKIDSIPDMSQDLPTPFAEMHPISPTDGNSTRPPKPSARDDALVRKRPSSTVVGRSPSRALRAQSQLGYKPTSSRVRIKTTRRPADFRTRTPMVKPAALTPIDTSQPTPQTRTSSLITSLPPMEDIPAGTKIGAKGQDAFASTMKSLRQQTLATPPSPDVLPDGAGMSFLLPLTPTDEFAEAGNLHLMSSPPLPTTPSKSHSEPVIPEATMTEPVPVPEPVSEPVTTVGLHEGPRSDKFGELSVANMKISLMTKRAKNLIFPVAPPSSSDTLKLPTRISSAKYSPSRSNTVVAGSKNNASGPPPAPNPFTPVMFPAGPAPKRPPRPDEDLTARMDHMKMDVDNHPKSTRKVRRVIGEYDGNGPIIPKRVRSRGNGKNLDRTAKVQAV